MLPAPMAFSAYTYQIDRLEGFNEIGKSEIIKTAAPRRWDLQSVMSDGYTCADRVREGKPDIGPFSQLLQSTRA